MILMGTVREENEMSRYIDASGIPINTSFWSEIGKLIENAPSIDLDDYVPKDFHDKTCEAMSERHQEEIANMVSVVRCKECKFWIGETEYYEDREYKACWQLCGQYMNSEFWCKYGEREGE